MSTGTISFSTAPEIQSAKIAGLNDAPFARQRIDHDGKTYTTIQEGLAYILIPPDTPVLTDPTATKDGTIPAQSVFYNPIQQYNRDLTVLAIRAFGEEYVAERQRELEKKHKKKKGKLKGERAVGDAAGGDGVKPASDVDLVGSRKTPTIGSGLKRTADEAQLQDAAESDGKDYKRMKASRQSNGAVTEDIADEDLLACENDITRTGPESVAKPAHADETSKNGTSKTPRVSFEILDALSATGLRALRYAHELPFVTSVTANDLSKEAVASIKLNVQHNKLQRKIKTNVGNANGHMYQSIGQESRGGPGNRYMVIDLDPYGTAVPFLDAAVQAISNGGLLCVTCTDSGVFNSPGFLEKTFSQYGGLPVKGEHCHEGGLRLILHAINTAAAKYGLSVEPLLSLSIDYYARVFVRIRKSPAEVKFHASRTMLVYACDVGCGAWTTQFMARTTLQEGKGKGGNVFHKYHVAQGPTASPTCEHCGFKTHLAGPMYGGPIHNPAFIARILSYIPTLDREVYATKDRIEGMLSTALEETELYPKPAKSTNPTTAKAKDSKSDSNKNHNADKTPSSSERPSSPPDSTIDKVQPITRLPAHQKDDHPFYLHPSHLARVLHTQAPPTAKLQGALRYLGYRVSRSHAKPGVIKTDAPWNVIWKIMLRWVKWYAPVRAGSVTYGMAGFKILQGLEEVEDAPGEGEEDEKMNVQIAGDEVDHTIQGKEEPNGNPVKNVSEDEVMNETSTTRQTNQQRQKPWVVFDEELGRDPDDLPRGKGKKRLVRYQANPRENWGPMARAKAGSAAATTGTAGNAANVGAVEGGSGAINTAVQEARAEKKQVAK